MKAKPVWWIGVLVYLVYNAIIYATWYAVGADYQNMAGPDVALTSLVLPLALGAVFVCLALAVLGWWRPVLSEDRRGGPMWALWAVLAVTVGQIVLCALATNWSALAIGHVALLIAASILVGFNEEAVTRGVLLVAMRGSIASETWVWFLTSALFGLMHLPNALFGLDSASAAGQVVFAFLAGTGFYILRRVSGTLLLPMLMHGLWDFTALALQASGGSSTPMKYAFQFGTYAISIALIYFVLRRSQRAADSAAPS